MMLEEAIRRALADIISGKSYQPTKRAVPDMVGEYLAMGWVLERWDEYGCAILIWPKEGTPP
jgi:hypothetical protein